MKDDYDGKMGYPKILVGDYFIEIEYLDKLAIADLNWNIVIPLKEYEWLIPDSDFIFVKEFDGEWEVYEVLDKSIEKIEYDAIFYQEEEFVAIKLYGKWEFFDLTEDFFDEEEYREEYEELEDE